MVSYRKKEGFSVVEMECAALAACAKFGKALWGEFSLPLILSPSLKITTNAVGVKKRRSKL